MHCGGAAAESRAKTVVSRPQGKRGASSRAPRASHQPSGAAEAPRTSLCSAPYRRRKLVRLRCSSRRATARQKLAERRVPKCTSEDLGSNYGGVDLLRLVSDPRGKIDAAFGAWSSHLSFRFTTVWLFGGGLSLLLSACAFGTEPKAPDARIRRDTEIVHEPCDTEGAGAESLDINGDGRGDLIKVFEQKRELCRAVDVNFDGKVDTWVYRNSDGTVRRRESDFDRDGRIDEIAVYSSGVLATKQFATNLAGRLDTWQFYDRGVLKRSERDSNGDSIIDQWWEYPRLPASDCSLVHSDVDGDGRPDPGATVDLCKDEPLAAPATQTEPQPAATNSPSQVPPPQAPPRASPEDPSAKGQPSDPASEASAPTKGAEKKEPTP